MSQPAQYDLCAIGNALVDITVSVEDTFLVAQGIPKGGMMLVDDARSKELYALAGASVELASGGSAANTIAGAASLGSHCAYIGKIGRDEFGDVFAHDMRAQGIHFATPPSADLPTGRCLVLVSPDAQRSMLACLGAATEYSSADVDASIIAASTVTYLEGYLFDKDEAKKAFVAAAKCARSAGRKLALSLSDLFCVARHRDAFLGLVKDEVDILFANEAEAKALFEVDDIAAAIARLRDQVKTIIVTRGAAGATLVSAGETVDVPAHPVEKVIDTTGAGDLYAAGFLHGFTHGADLSECGRLGAIAAAEVISHYGPRPQKKLSTLV